MDLNKFEKYAGLIFDCDGTLTDSMPLHYQTWRSVMSDHGVEFTEKRFYELAGVPAEKVAKTVGEENGVPLDNVQIAQSREIEFEKRCSEVVGIEPVIAVARHFRLQKPMAVASGSIRRSVEAQLTALGIVSWFQAIVTAEDTELHKPNPDVFLEAARRLKVDATQCCVFEDSDLGLEAASRAGMDAVDIRVWVGKSN